MSSSIFAMTPRVTVGISDLAVTNNSSVILSTYALGSCVGVIAYAHRLHTAGLLHAMLPSMSTNPNRKKTPLMFVDTGMPKMIKELVGFGALKAQIKIALIGGASINGGNDFFEIGSNNVIAVKAFCKTNHLKIAYEDSGGKVNRTVHFQMFDSQIHIKKPTQVDLVNFA